MDRTVFDSILLESTTNGLKFVLGEAPTKVILFHLGPIQFESLREFHNKLFSLLDEEALLLEKTIVKELFRRLNLFYEERLDLDFEKYVEQAKDAFGRRTKLR